MKSLDCNQIKLYINLEIIGEEDKYKKNYIYFLKISKKFLQFSSHLAQPWFLNPTFII